jgi:hypothetical protein
MKGALRTFQICILLAVTLALLAIWAHPARGHEWYDPWCCNEKDCGPIESKYVHETAEGWDIAPSEGGGFVPRGKERQSPDGGYHICRFPAQEIRCFYVPAMGS